MNNYFKIFATLCSLMGVVACSNSTQPETVTFMQGTQEERWASGNEEWTFDSSKVYKRTYTYTFCIDYFTAGNYGGCSDVPDSESGYYWTQNHLLETLGDSYFFTKTDSAMTLVGAKEWCNIKTTNLRGKTCANNDSSMVYVFRTSGELLTEYFNTSKVATSSISSSYSLDENHRKLVINGDTSFYEVDNGTLFVSDASQYDKTFVRVK